MKTQTSRAREALHESFFNNTLDGLAYCQMIFDKQKHPVDFIYLEVNKNFEALTGLKELVGGKATDFVPEIITSNPDLFEICGRVSLTGQPERFEIYIEPLSKWFLASAYSPEKEFFMILLQDITDKKQAEKDLENAKIASRNVFEDLQAEKEKIAEINAKYEAILASIADGCIAVNGKGEIILINQMAQKMLGYTSKESIGKQWYEILHREDESGNPISPEKGAINTALSAITTTTTTTSFYYLRKDGTKFPVSRTVSPVILRGKVIGAINIFRDITHEKELDRAKNEFISIASHQLRTPLTGIQWVIERFTKKENLTPKGREYLNDIHMSAKRLTKLVDLLLNLSRIEAGRVEITIEPLEVISLVKGCLDEYTPLCDKKELQLIFKDHPVELLVKTDKSALHNIVQNLVANAIEYTPQKGKIEITVKKEDDKFMIKVRDTGIGIPKAEQAHIFEKFMRASNAKLYKTDGIGIGLYIVERAINLLGGEILCESEKNKGSVFTVEMPVESRPNEREGKPLA